MFIDLTKALITGVDGMLGSYVDFGIRTNRQTLDLSLGPSVVYKAVAYQPSVIIHLAAQTNVDDSERNPESTFSTNSVGTYYLALAARKLKVPMVYISTSGIFDGQKKEPYTEDDEPNPQNIYSHSKYLGELAVRGLLNNYIIARIGWLFGGGPDKDRKFVGTILRQLEKPVTKVTEDQFGSPTYGKDVVKAICSLLIGGKRGIFNVVNKGIASRDALAKEIITIAGSTTKVESVLLSSFSFAATRIRNEGLTSENVQLRPWQEALREYYKSEWYPRLNPQNR